MFILIGIACFIMVCLFVVVLVCLTIAAGRHDDREPDKELGEEQDGEADEA